ncbi:MAG: phosphotransferase [Planctomycetaceae bacterium]|nr:phosphotransferase [Planctomycetaceae bacterium]
MRAAGTLAPVTEVSTLLQSIGVTGEPLLSALPGGRNNRLYQVQSGGHSWIAKAYFRDPDHPQQRQTVEWRFLAWADSRGIRCVPKPIACDLASGVSLLEFVDGSPIIPGQVTHLDLAAASDFFRDLQPPVHSRPQLPEASEACWTLESHRELVAARVARLAALSPHDEIGADCLEFVLRELQPRLLESIRVFDRQVGQWQLSLATELSVLQRSLSPSDFGYHNALRMPNGRICFVDFEYAGWDDPAKLVCDFFCQPRVPAPRESAQSFMEMIGGLVSDERALTGRVHALWPLYQVKWCCIVLNEFLQSAANRREFADSTWDADAQRHRQLQLARTLLEKWTPEWPPSPN